MNGSKALHEGFWREWLKDWPVRVSVEKRDGGYEIVASATKRKYFYVTWLPVRASKKQIENAAYGLRSEIAKREKRK